MNRLYPRFAALAFAASLAVTGGTLAATGAPAFAAELVVTGNPAPSTRVALGDLNLRSGAGLKRLEARVRTAAERLCIGTGTETLRARLDGLACRDAAISAAAPQIARAAGAPAGLALSFTAGR
jgi:UrcA family protein